MYGSKKSGLFVYSYHFCRWVLWRWHLEHFSFILHLLSFFFTSLLHPFLVPAPLDLAHNVLNRQQDPRSLGCDGWVSWVTVFKIKILRNPPSKEVETLKAVCHPDRPVALTLICMTYKCRRTSQLPTGGDLIGNYRELWKGDNQVLRIPTNAQRTSRLGGYGFRGTVTAGDGSNQKGGEMAAGYVHPSKE